MILEISALVASGALLLLVLFLIPSILQMRRTAKSLDETSKTLNDSLPSILVKIDGITSDVSTTSSTIKYRAEDLAEEIDRVIDLVHQGVDLGQNIQQSIKYPISESILSLTATLKGINAFFHVLRQKQQTGEQDFSFDRQKRTAY